MSVDEAVKNGEGMMIRGDRGREYRIYSLNVPWSLFDQVIFLISWVNTGSTYAFGGMVS
jgi:hypothetical protein